MFYTSNEFLIPHIKPGEYNTIAYSSTGIYYDKKCYVSVTVPPTGTIVILTLKVCDNNKSCV